MTSNIGSHIIQESFENASERNLDIIAEEANAKVLELLRATIRPEFLNRVDEIIMFKPLLKNEIKNIITIQLNGLKQLLLQSGITLEFTPYMLDFLADNGFDPQYGARPLKRLIQKQIINQLSKQILSGSIDKSKPVVVDVFDGLVVFRNEVSIENKSVLN